MASMHSAHMAVLFILLFNFETRSLRVPAGSKSKAATEVARPRVRTSLTDCCIENHMAVTVGDRRELTGEEE